MGTPLNMSNFNDAIGQECGLKLCDPRTTAVDTAENRKNHRDIVLKWPVNLSCLSQTMPHKIVYASAIGMFIEAYTIRRACILLNLYITVFKLV